MLASFLQTGIFVDQIEYILVLATPLEVILLGIAFSVNPSTGKKEMSLYATGMSTPSDNINMLSVTGSRNGRVFLAGGDGNLYELAYQTEDGWFTRKCRLINHSSSFSKFTPSFFNFMFTGGLYFSDFNSCQ